MQKILYKLDSARKLVKQMDIYNQAQPTLESLYIPEGISHLRRITEPINEPISLTDVKNYLRVDPDNDIDDNFINLLISMCREYCEHYTNRGLGVAQYEYTYDHLPLMRNRISLPVYPLISVESFSIKDVNDTENELDISKYVVETKRFPGAIFLPYYQIWPLIIPESGQAVTINFTAGYDTTPNMMTNNVPKRFIEIMYLMIATFYQNRSSIIDGKITEVPWAEKMLNALKVEMI